MIEELAAELGGAERDRGSGPDVAAADGESQVEDRVPGEGSEPDSAGEGS
jgi:hypothetical protein